MRRGGGGGGRGARITLFWRVDNVGSAAGDACTSGFGVHGVRNTAMLGRRPYVNAMIKVPLRVSLIGCCSVAALLSVEDHHNSTLDAHQIPDINDNVPRVKHLL